MKEFYKMPVVQNPSIELDKYLLNHYIFYAACVYSLYFFSR